MLSRASAMASINLLECNCLWVSSGIVNKGQDVPMSCFTRGVIGPTMSTATLLNCVSINGIDPSGTYLTLPLLSVLWHTSQERQNLMMPWRSPGQKKFGSILYSVFFAPRCPLNADSWFTDSTCLRSPLGTTNCLKLHPVIVS